MRAGAEFDFSPGDVGTQATTRNANPPAQTCAIDAQLELGPPMARCQFDLFSHRLESITHTHTHTRERKLLAAAARMLLPPALRYLVALMPNLECSYIYIYICNQAHIKRYICAWPTQTARMQMSQTTRRFICVVGSDGGLATERCRRRRRRSDDKRGWRRLREQMFARARAKMHSVSRPMKEVWKGHAVVVVVVDTQSSTESRATKWPLDSNVDVFECACSVRAGHVQCARAHTHR